MKVKAYIIYLDDCILLSKKNYSNWRDIQDEYYDKYKANLSPMTCEEIIDFFKDDFGKEDEWPFSTGDIICFFESSNLLISSNR